MSDNFQIAHAFTSSAEGGYCNVPGDRGGETYRGIARNFWGGWPGWDLIDQVKNQLGTFTTSQINHALAQIPDLDQLIDDFYREKFWKPFSLDLFPIRTATCLFDASVNHGQGNAILQSRMAVNLLQNSEIFQPLQSNWGEVAPAISDAATNNEAGLVESLITARKLFYDHLVGIAPHPFYAPFIRVNPSQEKFYAGWVNRLSNLWDYLAGLA